MTEQDELSAFRTLEAVGGRFDLSGITATADVTVAKFPAMVGMTARADFAVDPGPPDTPGYQGERLPQTRLTLPPRSRDRLRGRDAALPGCAPVRISVA